MLSALYVCFEIVIKYGNKILSFDLILYFVIKMRKVNQKLIHRTKNTWNLFFSFQILIVLRYIMIENFQNIFYYIERILH